MKLPKAFNPCSSLWTLVLHGSYFLYYLFFVIQILGWQPYRPQPFVNSKMPRYFHATAARLHHLPIGQIGVDSDLQTIEKNVRLICGSFALKSVCSADYWQVDSTIAHIFLSVH